MNHIKQFESYNTNNEEIKMVNENVSLDNLVSRYISGRHGSAVSDQFEDTFSNGEDFEDQNSNALSYIKNEIEDLINSGILADTYELEEYLGNLNDYLSD